MRTDAKQATAELIALNEVLVEEIIGEAQGRLVAMDEEDGITNEEEAEVVESDVIREADEVASDEEAEDVEVVIWN